MRKWWRLATAAASRLAVVQLVVVVQLIAVELIAVGLFTVSGAAPAEAKARQVATSPAGPVVKVAPLAVSVTFDTPLRAGGAQLQVISRDGDVGRGPASVVAKTLRRDLVSGAPNGVYRVTWRALSADGVPISGAFTFTAAAGNGPSAPVAVATSAPATSGTGAVPTASPAAPSVSPSGSVPSVSASVSLGSAPIVLVTTPSMVSRSGVPNALGTDGAPPSGPGRYSGFTAVPLTLGALLVLVAGLIPVMTARRRRAESAARGS